MNKQQNDKLNNLAKKLESKLNKIYQEKIAPKYSDVIFKQKNIKN